MGADTEVKQAGSAPPPRPPDPGGRVKDKWDKADVILKPLGALLTALTVAVVTYMASNYLNRSQEKEAKFRLYTELMTRREESESALRKDMFNTIMASILREKGDTPLDDKILQLELLTYNFHESLNLMPLFEYLDRNNKIYTHDPVLRQAYKNRLIKMARNISEKQMSSLEGKSKRILLYYQDTLVTCRNRPEYRKDSLYRERIDDLRDRNSEALYLDDQFQWVKFCTHTDSIRTGNEYVPVQYVIRVKVLDYDTSELSARVQLTIQTRNPADSAAAGSIRMKEFIVNYFEFPMIDNTRLENDMRVAVVLTGFSKNTSPLMSENRKSICNRMEFRVIFFPGTKASLKERPYIDDIVSKLVSSRKD